MTSIKVIYGNERCGDCKRAKKFLDERGYPYAWIDIDKSAEGRQKVNELSGRIPTIVFVDGSMLVEPTNNELKKKLKEKEK